MSFSVFTLISSLASCERSYPTNSTGTSDRLRDRTLYSWQILSFTPQIRIVFTILGASSQNGQIWSQIRCWGLNLYFNWIINEEAMRACTIFSWRCRQHRFSTPTPAERAAGPQLTRWTWLRKQSYCCTQESLESPGISSCLHQLGEHSRLQHDTTPRTDAYRPS